MKLEDQVCSLELAKKLKELGVKQESLSYWYTCEDCNNSAGSIEWELTQNPHIHPRSETYSAFTVAELGDIIQKIVGGYFFTQLPTTDNRWYIYYRDAFGSMKIDGEEVYTVDVNEANARAKMLIHLIENDLIKVSE